MGLFENNYVSKVIAGETGPPDIAILKPTDIDRTGVGSSSSGSDFTGGANQYLGILGDVARDMVLPEIQVSEIDSPDSPSFMTTQKPGLETVSWTLPGFPQSFNQNLNIDNLLPEAFDQSPPQLAFPTAPTPNFGDVPAAPGVNVPTADPQLNLDLPDAPQLLDLNVSKFDGVQLPAIDFDVPEFTVAAPSIKPYTPGAGYSSSLLTALKDQLLDSIQNGGTGLNPDVENAIWDRGREREYRQASDALAELDRMESMGFHLPPGVYADGRFKVQTELSKNIAGHSREVMIKQAELELQNVQQALQTAEAAEAKALEINEAVEQRSFEAARYATQAGIELYNAKVRAYGAYVEAYRSKVAIYEAQVRAELSKVEAYKAEVDAEQSKAQINQARVEQFRTMTDAALSAVEVYKAEIAGIQAKADIERLKIQIFGEQVRAHGNEVNAYTAQVEGFRAAVGAEASKQEAFQSAVGAYGAQVDASAKAIDARISEYTAKLRAKESEWQGYTSQAQVEAERIKSISAKNESVARMYQAEASASASYNDVLAKQWQSETQLAINAANVALEEAKANAELYVTKRSMISDAAKVGATVSAQLGAAAISANNFSRSISQSDAISRSQSITNATSTSYSQSDSTSSSTSRSFSDQDITTRSV